MKSLKSQNYYDILGVTRNATPEEIRSAFEISRHTFQENSLATYSLFSDQENQEILALIAKAFETLFNPESRRAYDTALSEQEGEAPQSPRRAPGPTGHSVAAPSAPSHSTTISGVVPPAAQPSTRARVEGDATRRAATVGPPVSASGATVGEPGRLAASAARTTALPPPSPPGPALHGAPASTGLGAGVQTAAPRPAPVSEKPPPSPAREEYLKTVTRFDGPALKKLRLITGISLEEMAEKSKIRRAYLEYIEEENFQFLPAPVYVKGFVTLMANILGAPAQRAAEDYMIVVRAKKHGD